jgi:hypothetical protein
MLEEPYKEKLDSLLATINWSIQLPPRLSDFFSVRGDSQSAVQEERKHIRIRARAKCPGFFESTLPSLHRDSTCIPIYTADFSRGGCGFISAIQIFPTERLRLILPTFWLQLQIVRCRKLGPRCYEIGSILVAKNQPNPVAFDLQKSIN